MPETYDEIIEELRFVSEVFPAISRITEHGLRNENPLILMCLLKALRGLDIESFVLVEELSAKGLPYDSIAKFGKTLAGQMFTNFIAEVVSSKQVAL